METEYQERVPVNILWDDVLFVALQGTLDSRRTQVMLESVLTKIHETGASTLILDILGVGVVDSAVANHLLKMGQATKLMGCETVISGISPEIAQTIVQLGVDLGGTTTTSTIRDALKLALKNAGQEITALS